MRSLHAWIVLSMAATLLLALGVFLAISNQVQRVYLYPVFEAMDELELEQAVEAWHQGGPTGVSGYMRRLDQLFGVHHYLLDAHGRDVTSGADLQNLLPQSQSAHKSRAYVKQQLVISHESSDGRYWFLAVDTRQTNPWTFFPYYALVVGVTGIIYWLATAGILRPVQRIQKAIDRFGQGDLTVRTRLRRRDEIGALSRSFDGMAERMQTLLESERRLLTDISHELRSPLTRLKLAVKLAETNHMTDGSAERLKREVNRIAALVSEITELTRVEGDPPSRKLEQVSLGEVIGETVRDCQLEAEQRGCRIETSGRIAGSVNGDRELLRRVFENVLRNAIRYSPQHSAIECELSDESAAVITVRDFGPGVPDDMLTQIFEAFVRVDESRNAESGGMGLGLAIARRAVQVHKGTITAENARPGLRIQITIPMVYSSR